MADYPNSMTVGQSYSEWLGPEEGNDEIIDPCETCEVKGLSECCVATIMYGDICSVCREHCGSMCDECENKKPIK